MLYEPDAELEDTSEQLWVCRDELSRVQKNLLLQRRQIGVVRGDTFVQHHVELPRSQRFVKDDLVLRWDPDRQLKSQEHMGSF